MSNAPKLDFVVFYVADLEKAYSYFTETLGLEADPTQAGPVFRGFKAVEGSIAFGLSLASEAAGPEPRQPGDAVFYFKTDQLQETHSALLAKGVEPGQIVQRPFGAIFSVPSPDGHLITMLGTSAD